MTSPCGKIRIPLNESQDDHSQIEEFLEDYHGEGIQHIALGTDDIFDDGRDAARDGRDVPGHARHLLRAASTRACPGHGEDPAAPAARPHPGRRRADRGPGPAAADLHRERDRPDLLRDHPAQGQRGLRRGQLQGPVRIDRARPDPPRRAEGHERRHEHARTGSRSRASRAPPRGRRTPTCRRAPTSARSARRASSAPRRLLSHAHPPTGWSDFEGPLRPRAFDPRPLANAAAEPVGRADVLANAHLQMRFWKLRPSRWPQLARNATATSCCSCTRAAAISSATSATWPSRRRLPRDLPRGTMWRLAPRRRPRSLLIEATNAQLHAARARLLGPHAIFDPAMLDTPAIDDAFRPSRTSATGRSSVKRRDAGLHRDLSRSTRSMRWAGTAIWRRCAQLARHPPGDEPPLPLCRPRCTRPSWPTASWSAPSCRARSRPIPAR